MQLPHPAKKSLVNLTPLIDVVFILLIFFMLVSNFIRWHAIELSVGETGEIVVNPLSLSIVTINSDSNYLLNRQVMSLDEIISTLKPKVVKQPDHSIVIQPEQGSNVQAMVDILKLLKEFAGDNISITRSSNSTDNL